MRILYISTVGSTMHFFKEQIHSLITEGNQIDIATNNTSFQVPDCYEQWGCRVFPISCSRSPIDINNMVAIKQIKDIVLTGEYNIVHCHTPIAAAATRFACRKLRKSGLKVIYTAHGFHFYKGAPKKNWIIYYPIEKICSRWTDVIVTINKEDYAIAQEKMHAKRVEYIPGVGIDVDKFSNTVVNIAGKRHEIGVPENAFLILSVGELNRNKNHQVLIRALAELHDSSIYYAIAGIGDKHDELRDLASKLHVNLRMLGYRNDVAELYKIADLYSLPSIREGLNVSVMEALASGLPCAVSNIRGNVDIIQNGKNGYFMVPTNVSNVKQCIMEAVRKNISSEICHESAQIFRQRNIHARIKEIYESVSI